MALQFIKKKFRKTPEYIITPQIKQTKDVEEVALSIPQENKIDIEEPEKVKKNNKKNSKDDMIDKSKISEIEAAIKDMQPEVKVVKKDRGLIERTESSKIIITEDNRQVLID
jgi:hypothetical protein